MPNLTRSGGIDDPKLFGTLTFHTLVVQHGVRILNNLTGRSRHSPRHCPVSANAIASQLVRNGRYEAVNCKSSQLVSQEVSDLWMATTPVPVNISDTLSQREFTAAFQHLKPGKSMGFDSIFPQIIIDAGDALKSWLRDFFFSCLHKLKIPKIWRKVLVVAILKPVKPVGNRKSFDQYLSFVFPTRSSRGLSMPVSRQLFIHFSLGSKQSRLCR